MLPEMLRVALSIGAGRIKPSAILRQLATYSRKNKLYFAFRELGSIVRTIFLLEYMSSIELRRTIQAATNKSEAFNLFCAMGSVRRRAALGGEHARRAK
jgi:TnpA family transposase